MISIIIAFAAGLIIGGGVGLITAALMVAAKRKGGMTNGILEV